MDIIDYTKFCRKSTNQSNHAPFLPRTIFCVIAGATGCGKTNLMTNFLLNEKWLDYSSVYIYSPTLYQSLYQYLQDYYTDLENVLRCKFKMNIKVAHFFDSDEEIKDPSELNPEQRHVMIFDDVMNAVQSKIKDYFCRGRHNNVNVFYLCQSLHKIQKHCIRQNANVFVLFKQDVKTLKYFHESHISGDMNFEEFRKMCDDAWKAKHGFVVINLWEEAYCGRYIINYKHIYTPSTFKVLITTVQSYNAVAH